MGKNKVAMNSEYVLRCLITEFLTGLEIKYPSKGVYNKKWEKLFKEIKKAKVLNTANIYVGEKK